MKVYGFEVTDEIIEKSLAMLDDGLTATLLAKYLKANGVPDNIGKDYIAIAAASRVIRALQKDGRAKKVYGGGRTTLFRYIKNPKKNICR